MATSKEIRLKNARALAVSSGGIGKFADVVEISQSQASQIIGTNPIKGIGDALARRIEAAYKKSEGWLDVDDVDAPAESNSQNTKSLSTSQQHKAVNGINIPMFDVSFSMGQGAFQQDYEDIISAVTVTNEWVNTNIPNITSAHNLRIASGRGDSMLGTYSHGDMLFIDCGVNGVPFDGVYAFMLNEQLYIKRLQKRPDGAYNMISDNKQYDTFIITTRDSFHVFGRVVCAWNGKRL